jgi:prolyl-tRNA synthetase
LGTKYTDALGVNYLDENGKEHPVVMGSYGIGVERVLACYLEQNHDERGIVWDQNLAPFQIHLIGLNMKNEEINSAATKLYEELTSAHYDVLFDDRMDASAGFKFNDADLMGMPIQIIVGEKNYKNGNVELKNRRTGEKEVVALTDIRYKLNELLN